VGITTTPPEQSMEPKQFPTATGQPIQAHAHHPDFAEPDEIAESADPYSVDDAADVLGMAPWQLLAFDATLSPASVISGLELGVIRRGLEIARQVEQGQA